MKKICIVNFNVYCLFNPRSLASMGGAELDMYTLAKGLEGNHEVSVITGDWEQEEVEVFGSIRVVRSFKLTKVGLYELLRSLFLFLRNLLRVDADIYIISGAGPEVGIISAFCQYKKKKFIYRTASEIDCNKKYINSNGIKGLMYKYGLERADNIVTTVQQHRDLLQYFHPLVKDRISHINLGVFKDSPDENQKESKDSVLWVGRCDSLKKPEIFLDIAKSLSKFSCIMICPRQGNNPKFFEEIKRMAVSLPNVTFIDFVPFKDIQPYFNRAKVFVNTSDFEGFTYTLIQSGLARTPVVYLNVNPDKVITHYNLGYVSDGEKDKMLIQINTLMSDRNDWKEKSENVYKYVQENHDINIIRKQWKDLIDKTLLTSS